MFLQLDANKTGCLTKPELYDMLDKLKLKMSKEQIEGILESIDFHHSGKIHYTEFLAATIYQPEYLTEERMQMVFNYLDVHKKGYLTKEDLKDDIEKWNYEVSLDDIEELIKMVDPKTEGKITYETFKFIMKGDLKLPKIQKGLGTLITRRLSK